MTNFHGYCILALTASLLLNSAVMGAKIYTDWQRVEALRPIVEKLTAPRLSPKEPQ